MRRTRASGSRSRSSASKRPCVRRPTRDVGDPIRRQYQKLVRFLRSRLPRNDDTLAQSIQIGRRSKFRRREGHGGGAQRLGCKQDQQVQGPIGNFHTDNLTARNAGLGQLIHDSKDIRREAAIGHTDVAVHQRDRRRLPLRVICEPLAGGAILAGRLLGGHLHIMSVLAAQPTETPTVSALGPSDAPARPGAAGRCDISLTRIASDPISGSPSRWWSVAAQGETVP